jgi:hypothetical protein
LEGGGERSSKSEVACHHQELSPQSFLLEVIDGCDDVAARTDFFPARGSVRRGEGGGGDVDGVGLIVRDNLCEIDGVASILLGVECILGAIKGAGEVEVELGLGDGGERITENEDVIPISGFVAVQSVGVEFNGKGCWRRGVSVTIITRERSSGDVGDEDESPTPIRPIIGF